MVTAFRLERRPRALLAALWVLLVVAGCSKSLPSSPGTPAGTAVILQVQPRESIARTVTVTGTVINQSGRTIYDVRVGMTVYRDDPFFEYVTDTSEVKVAMLPHDESAPITAFTMAGDDFKDVFPVWTYFPPTR